MREKSQLWPLICMALACGSAKADGQVDEWLGVPGWRMAGGHWMWTECVKGTNDKVADRKKALLLGSAMVRKGRGEILVDGREVSVDGEERRWVTVTSTSTGKRVEERRWGTFKEGGSEMTCVEVSE